jgi:hypothetical protein
MAFRYHFKFPDNEFEIPIVAVSPTASNETDSFFSSGIHPGRDVGATAQPEHLGVPMGERH